MPQQRPLLLEILIGTILLTGCVHTDPPGPSMNARLEQRRKQHKAPKAPPTPRPVSTTDNSKTLFTWKPEQPIRKEYPRPQKNPNAPAVVITYDAPTQTPPGSRSKKILPTIIEGGPLDVGVGWNADSLTLSNTGTSDISGKLITFYLNGHYSKGYKATCTGPARGKSIKTPLLTFIRSTDGARFNGYTHSITRIYIHCPGHEEAYYTPIQ